MRYFMNVTTRARDPAVELRTINRGSPASNPIVCRFKVLVVSVSPRRQSSLSFMHDLLTTESCGHVEIVCLCAVIAAWHNESYIHRVGVEFRKYAFDGSNGLYTVYGGYALNP